MEFTAEALIVKVGLFRETDQWVRFLAPEQGLVTAFAFGGAISRRRFCGCLDGLNLVRLHAASDSRRRYLHLTEASLLDSWPRLRRQPRLLGAAVNCASFAAIVQPGPEGAAETFGLLADTLRALDQADGAPESLPLYFRARMLFVLGLGPELTTCLVCHQAVEDMASPRFLVEQGRVACERCRVDDRAVLSVSAGALAVLAHLSRTTPAQWLRLDLPRRVREEVYRLVEAFGEHHLGLAQRQGRYRRS